MLLTVSTTHRPATDLGYLLVKHPDRVHTFAVAAGTAFRHSDHRFEWTRAQYTRWAERVAGEFGYRVTASGVGPAEREHGSPSQLAVFRRES